MTSEAINLLILSGFGLLYIALIFFLGYFKSFPRFKTSFFTEKQEQFSFFDFIRGIAILAVIIIHVSFFLSEFPDKFPLYFLELSEHIGRLSRFAIPFFIISSGILLTLKDLKKETLKKFYFKKIKRIFIPYIFFSFLATLVYSDNITTLPRYIGKAVWDVLTGTGSLPYWFLAVLVQLYIIYPLIWYLFVVKKVKPYILLSSSFVFSLAYYLISTQWNEWTIIFGNFYFLGSFLFFFVLGMVLKPLVLSKEREWLKKIGIVPWTIAITILFLGISNINPLNRYFNVRLIYGTSLFLLLYYLYPKISKFSAFFQKIGKASLYIYLIHFLILSILIKILVIYDFFYINPFVLFASLAIFNLILTYIVSIFLKKLYCSLTQRT